MGQGRVGVGVSDKIGVGADAEMSIRLGMITGVSVNVDAIVGVRVGTKSGVNVDMKFGSISVDIRPGMNVGVTVGEKRRKIRRFC